jgi:glycosyltransferase involved in cell wall biosynthesis
MASAVRPRVLVMTAGALSTCPRMLKAADALACEYDVRVVSADYGGWAHRTDAELGAGRPWAWTVVRCDRRQSPWTYGMSGVRHRLSQRVARTVGPARAPWTAVKLAFSRLHAELVRAAVAAPFDFAYGGTTGALAAVAEAASVANVPYGIDLEDFHRGEHDSAGWMFNAMAARIETSAVRDARFVTTSSAAIAEAYRVQAGVDAAVVHNTFPLSKPPLFSAPDAGTLRLYWFSQTIGPGRGLEDAVAAAGRAGLAGSLDVRGVPIAGYADALHALGRTHAPRLTIRVLPPAAPGQMIELARPYDVGLALEQPDVPNRALCLTNKAFTYLVAGLAVAMTDTPGQHPLAVAIGDGGALVQPGTVDQLAAVFARWRDDPRQLDRAKRASWRAAVERWNWDHPLERPALVDLVRRSVERADVVAYTPATCTS